MRILYFLILFCLIVSCKKNKSKQKVFCKKQDLIIKDTLFDESDILSSFYYGDSCRIKKLNMFVFLDKRSGNITSREMIKDVSVKLGFYPDTLVNFLISNKKISLHEVEKGVVLNVKHDFKTSFLDSINFIDLKTISINNTEGKMKILKSDSYFYNNSKSLLGIQDSYLDYKAFEKEKIKYKILSKEGDYIDTILFTVKTNNIDNIKLYDIIVNSINLNFTYSIKASFKNFKNTDKGCLLYDVVKLNKDFLRFKLNINSLKLESLDEVIVKLDGINVD